MRESSACRSRPAVFVCAYASPVLLRFPPDLLRDVALRRTFAIISHPDAGKTTLTEKLLLFGGAIQLAGTVKARKSARHATSDWMEVEKQRGISVTSSVMQFAYAGHAVNLLDTPGHEDFSEDTYRVLTAVDAAVMVIDAAKGVEAQTIKLLEVCRLRDTPIITFVNKMDREVREPLELLEEIESVLELDCAPITWPVGMGKAFRGVYHLLQRPAAALHAGRRARQRRHRADRGPRQPAARRAVRRRDRRAAPRRRAAALREPAVRPRRVPRRQADAGVLRLGDQQLRRAGDPAGADRLGAAAAAARRQRRASSHPAEAPFSGFVFKIQANMDPRHRDRIAFFRVCSGRYAPGMKVRHLRAEREMKLANALTFMANERVMSEDAVAGDIIGIHNHGQLQIGDTLTEGEALAYKGIPYFAPELFRVARPRDPFKPKQLAKGLQELGEEGAIQVFETGVGQHAAARRRRSAAVRDRRAPARDRVQGRRDLRDARTSRRRAGSPSPTRPCAATSSSSRRRASRPTSTAIRCSSRRTSTTCRSRWSAGRGSAFARRASTASACKRLRDACVRG